MKMISMVGQMNCKWTDIRDELLVTDLEFNNVDYLEAYSYLVLNWTQEEARRSNLRRVLPTRRGKRGTKRDIITLLGAEATTRKEGGPKG